MDPLKTVAAVAAAGSRAVNDLFGRFIPEPASRVGIDFRSALSAASSVVSGGTFPGIDGDYAELLNKQIEMQQQMQLVTMQSNIEKSRHETQMAPVRNIRVG